jgi:hypothetical protein
MICLDCQKKEQERPDYKQAQEREAAEIRQGSYNSPALDTKG